ncbi:MAG TPA: ABC transporter ATP-binding protein [Solirubrobacteraceae bacterium]|jgi:putative ABC transport system ATP-binding protein
MSVLSLTGVCLSFPRGRRHVIRVLADVTFELDAGETVAVLAQRAQGKTSLLRVAAGIERPDRGCVRFEGEDIWEFSERRRSRLLGGQIGWVGPAVPDLDVPMLADVALPLFATYGKSESYARARAALARVGAEECAEQLWGSLADWERALVAVAKGIAREPRLLLVDDLTLSLGLAEADEITRLLDTLAVEQGFAVLMSVSDAAATSWSRRVATLAGGELLESVRPPAREGNIIDFPAAGQGGREQGRGIS